MSQTSHRSQFFNSILCGEYSYIFCAIKGAFVILVLFLLLIFAVFADMTTDRVPNFLIVSGILGGILYQFFIIGNCRPLEILWSAAIPVLVLFPLFAFRAMGAGDLKLLAMTGVFLSPGDSFKTLIFALVAGALIGLGKMLFFGNFIDRFRYFGRFAKKFAEAFGRKQLREMIVKDGENPGYMSFTGDKDKKKAEIHFTVPILIAAVLVTGGFV